MSLFHSLSGLGIIPLEFLKVKLSQFLFWLSDAKAANLQTLLRIKFHWPKFFPTPHTQNKNLHTQPHRIPSWQWNGMWALHWQRGFITELPPPPHRDELEEQLYFPEVSGQWTWRGFYKPQDVLPPGQVSLCFLFFKHQINTKQSNKKWTAVNLRNGLPLKAVLWAEVRPQWFGEGKASPGLQYRWLWINDSEFHPGFGMGALQEQIFGR